MLLLVLMLMFVLVVVLVLLLLLLMMMMPYCFFLCLYCHPNFLGRLVYKIEKQYSNSGEFQQDESENFFYHFDLRGENGRLLLMFKTIALDIDGTITKDRYSVPLPVIEYLHHLFKEGWNFVFATGRPFAFAIQALSKFEFPYLFLVQNGSLALEMPSQKVVYRQYIPASKLVYMERAYEGVQSDFLIYAGYEKGDFCYYRPHRFSAEALHYLEDLQKRQKEKWKPLSEFNANIMEDFPLIKCFGTSKCLAQIGAKLHELFAVTQIQDPFAKDMDLLLITDRGVSKGDTLKKMLKGAHFLIAAGDDVNDLSLLDAADMKIAMPHAPICLKEKADWIAPPIETNGIISALTQAISHANP